MENQIRHDGIIDSVAPGLIRVRIMQTSACAACKVASHCHASEAKEKIVDVDHFPDRPWHVGQHVVVSALSRMTGLAALIAFGLPLTIMLVLLLVLTATGCDEGRTALIMLGALAVYYFLVWMCRGLIADRISFRLEEPGETDEAECAGETNYSTKQTIINK